MRVDFEGYVLGISEFPNSLALKAGLELHLSCENPFQLAICIKTDLHQKNGLIPVLL